MVKYLNSTKRHFNLALNDLQLFVPGDKITKLPKKLSNFYNIYLWFEFDLITSVVRLSKDVF